MNSKTLTLQDELYKLIKLQQGRFKPILNTHRLIILKEVSLGIKSAKTLKFYCVTSDGNLASHMRVMAQEGLVEVIKEFEKNYPKTNYKITKKGMKLYQELEKFLKDLLNVNQLKSQDSVEIN
jgi:DNA-binding HxlR family transcriptional regulator